MYIVTLDWIPGGLFGPFDTKQEAEDYLAADKGNVVVLIPPIRRYPD